VTKHTDSDDFKKCQMLIFHSVRKQNTQFKRYITLKFKNTLILLIKNTIKQALYCLKLFLIKRIKVFLNSNTQGK
jgi:hypothetical protein